MTRRERAFFALVVALSAAWIVLFCFRPSGTEDLWWTLKVGDYVRSEGAVPRTLLWTIEAVADFPYVCHAWLAALAYSSVTEAFGLDAIPAVPTLIAVAVFASLLRLARALGASWLCALLVADLALYVVLPRMICRAEVFGFLYLGLALLGIASFLRTRRIRAIAWLVPFTVLWANTHGSFLLLLALLPLVGAGVFLDAWRGASFRREALLASLFSRESAALFAVWLLAWAASLVNPYGLDLIRSVLAQSTSEVWRATIQEWQPLYADGMLPARFLVPAALGLAALATGFRRLSFVSLLLAGCMAALALASHRHMVLFGFGSAFLLADWAHGVEPGRRPRVALAATLFAALVAAIACSAAPLDIAERSLGRHPSAYMTERGLEFVRSRVHGNVLNRWHLGGLLIYFAHPQVRVCIDSRADPYPREYFEAYQRALYGTARDTLGFVDAYALEHIVVDRGLYERSFRPKLGELGGFRLVYADERTVVLSRTIAAPWDAGP
jgi:hypothetical protein